MPRRDRCSPSTQPKALQLCPDVTIISSFKIQDQASQRGPNWGEGSLRSGSCDWGRTEASPDF